MKQENTQMVNTRLRLILFDYEFPQNYNNY